MFYQIKMKDHIRIPPREFGKELNASLITQIKAKYEGYIDKEVGVVIDVLEINEIGKGIIIPGDGACHYEVVFDVVSFKPELQEVVMGKVTDVADFGAFVDIGCMDGMVHISQTMDDFVSFSKDKVLLGKDSKKTLKIDDDIVARIIAVSYKDPSNPKIGLTMRQQYLGKPEWSEDNKVANEKSANEKSEKSEKTTGKKEGKEAKESKGKK